MPRPLLVVFVCLLGRLASGHDEPPAGLPCDTDAGEACYYALIDDFHANPSTTDATGEIFLTLNAARTQLRYSITLGHELGLKPNPADRTEPDDILGMHLHLHVPDTIGPHVLNLFGLATPSLYAEEDADLLIDYDERRLTGLFDNSDATIDPSTGLPYPQFFFATSKLLTDWLDELESGEIVLAVHTVESGFRNFAIHGHIRPVVDAEVPEPGCATLLATGAVALVLSSCRFR